MANLYTIAAEYQSLMDEILALDGEITEEIGEKLAIAEKDLEGKLKAYYSIIKLKQTNTTLIKSEVERLESHIDSNEAVIKRLSDVCKWAVETFGIIKPKAKQKSITLDTLTITNKETESVTIYKDFEEVIKDGEHDQYFTYDFRMVLTPAGYKTMLKLLDQVNISLNDGAGSDYIEELLPLATKAVVIPNKTAIKDYYKDREELIKLSQEPPVDNILGVEVPPALPGCSISHNLTPIFK